MATRSTGLRDLEELNITYLEEDPEDYNRGRRVSCLSAVLRGRKTARLFWKTALRTAGAPGSCRQPGHCRPARNRVLCRTGPLCAPAGRLHRDCARILWKTVSRHLRSCVQDGWGPIDHSRVLMVGDSLHTDILGCADGRASRQPWWRNTDFFAGHDAEKAVMATGIFPDFIVERP